MDVVLTAQLGCHDVESTTLNDNLLAFRVLVFDLVGQGVESEVLEQTLDGPNIFNLFIDLLLLRFSWAPPGLSTRHVVDVNVIRYVSYDCFNCCLYKVHSTHFLLYFAVIRQRINYCVTFLRT